MVDADAEEVLDGALCELLTAVSVGGVDLVVAVARDGDARVARDGEERGLVFHGVDGRDHERIAASHIIAALVDAHDHNGRLVRGDEQILLVLSLRAVEQTALGEECARNGSEYEDENDAEEDVWPDSFLFC